MNKSLLSSRKMDYETPGDLFNPLDDIFKFDIDLAANKENSKCINYIDKEINSLNQDWNLFANWCWLNPPYGRSLGKWIEKSYNSFYCKICLLIPSRTDTKYFHRYITKSRLIIFLSGRLKFSNDKNSAPFPSMLVFFGNITIEEIEKLEMLNLGFIIKNKDL